MFNNVEPKEAINMVATIAFFIYFYVLVRNGRCKLIPEVWLYAIFLITIANIATVVEDIAYRSIFNFIEHFSFTCACVLFLVGAYYLKPDAKP